jgi:hypothetical protein
MQRFTEEALAIGYQFELLCLIHHIFNAPAVTARFWPVAVVGRLRPKTDI